MLIDYNSVVVIREDRGEYLRDFLESKFRMPMYLSEKMFQGLTGFPMSKGLNQKITVASERSNPFDLFCTFMLLPYFHALSCI